jgi:hypothetical protein
VLIVLKSGSLNLLEPSGPVTGLLYVFEASSEIKNIRDLNSGLNDLKKVYSS